MDRNQRKEPAIQSRQSHVRSSVGIGRISSRMVPGTPSNKSAIGSSCGPCEYFDMAICTGLSMSGHAPATSSRSAKGTRIPAARLLSSRRADSNMPTLLRGHSRATAFDSGAVTFADWRAIRVSHLRPRLRREQRRAIRKAPGSEAQTIEAMTRPNHALQRTRPCRSGFKRHLLWAGSLSLGR